ncbi:MAG: hypothetical protein C0623_14610 [Desulfuromonas sp.]|nr:MAG: hypothetical protein C0623_14610 [Desulfuromonas sp.]
MKCPVCKSREHLDTDLHSQQFSEHIIECNACGAVWSMNHGHLDLVDDRQGGSFLQASTEAVEGDDYNQMG